MASQTNENSEFCVDEGAFWHTNMDLYYGYTVGEVVEVEHEVNKYWLATIKYCFKHLILLKWIGNDAEFWIDTSTVSTMVANTQSAFDEPNNQPKRLYPLGYHLQMQLKSQFKLEKPTKVLETPSLYNPSKDPYADIKTVDDLLAHEVDQSNDTFNMNQSSTNNIEPASLVLAKCNTKINYKQEDVDEVEAALQNLNEIDNALFDDHQQETEGAQVELDPTNLESNQSQMIGVAEQQAKYQEPVSSKSSSMSENESNEISGEESSDSTQQKKYFQSPNGPKLKNTSHQTGTFESDNNVDSSSISVDPENCDEIYIQLCKRLQESVINRGYYNAIDASGKQQTERIFHAKPKQFFDVGGANHERVFVPGTLLEVCHTRDSPTLGLELCYWFAYVVKNVGGRLTLRWLLSDEPKFRQGRLELKYRHSKWIKEEEESDESNTTTESSTCKKSPIDSNESNGTKQQSMIPVKAINFSLHFCDPRISTIEGETKEKCTSKSYQIPEHVSSFIEQTTGNQTAVELMRSMLMGSVFNSRRLHLDKDRPLIDNIISTVRSRQPTYLDLEFSNNGQQTNREVLISCPEMTKLLKGYILNELQPGVYEVHSEPLTETEEIIKFIYPYDSSYAILPLDWANNNQDCLSIDPSRNPTPTLSDQAETQDNDHCNQEGQQATSKSENNAPSVSSFHCRIDNKMREFVESKFKIMDQLEVVHPSSDTTICFGRIRKLVYPLIWIQISPDCYTLLPFTSTNIYPSRWCETYNHPVVSLLPPRKKFTNQSSSNKRNGDSNSNSSNKKRKKVTLAIEKSNDIDGKKSTDDGRQLYEKEHFDLNALNFRQTDLNYMLNEKSNYIKIYFNHKCFTGPSLSKSKICSLPQYVGPGPLRLVMEEVVTKVISVAYVPPRILNDLSSGTFQRLLIDKNIALKPMEFKAKYQKRIHREDILVCVNPDDVALYCESVCEHIKCCYNLFGPNSYDGDDCPGHCRALTKSNKFMKRATYYRDKARAGEFLGNNSNNNNSNQTKANQSQTKNINNKTNSNDEEDKFTKTDEHATDNNDQAGIVEMECQNIPAINLNGDQPGPPTEPQIIIDSNELDCSPVNEGNENSNDNCENQGTNNIILRRSTNSSEWSIEPEFDLFESRPDSRPESWTIDDVAERLDWCRLGRFKSILKSEGIDGQALMLLDKAAIREHFQGQLKAEYTPEDLSKLTRFVEYVKSNADIAG